MMQNTKPVTIYTTQICPFCIQAKALLTKKEIEFTEIDVSSSPEIRAEMIERANGRSTVPQIFIGDHHIGGCDELHMLEAQGRLDELLAS